VDRSAGNNKLKAARQARGYATQQALAGALNAEAASIGMRDVAVGVRQVRRWESPSPPWPHGHHQQLLRRVLGLDLDLLGFTPPWENGEPAVRSSAPNTAMTVAPNRPRRPRPVNNASDGATARELAAVTAVYRRLYWSVDPLQLRPAVAEHVRLGFFDMRTPEVAAASFTQALQVAGEAEDSLLGAAILAHAAFVPGWSGDRLGASERLAAARAHARRAHASPLMWAWIDAVDAECATRCGDLRDALALIDRAESHLRGQNEPASAVPDWMDWFSTVRLAAFKGNTLLAAGHARRARDTLQAALDQLGEGDAKQRAVVLADLAAAELAAGDVAMACDLLGQALDQLAVTWYLTGMERIRGVRRLLHPHRDEQVVRDFDDRLYGWEATLTATRS
jgi:tetratricopeptide (TPR) repeat protein